MERRPTFGLWTDFEVLHHQPHSLHIPCLYHIPCCWGCGCCCLPKIIPTVCLCIFLWLTISSRVTECQPLCWKVVGSHPGWIIPNSIIKNDSQCFSMSQSLSVKIWIEGKELLDQGQESPHSILKESSEGKRSLRVACDCDRPTYLLKKWYFAWQLYNTWHSCSHATTTRNSHVVSASAPLHTNS